MSHYINLDLQKTDFNIRLFKKKKKIETIVPPTPIQFRTD